jgi:hypothetical protein
VGWVTVDESGVLVFVVGKLEYTVVLAKSGVVVISVVGKTDVSLVSLVLLETSVVLSSILSVEEEAVGVVVIDSTSDVVSVDEELVSTELRLLLT